MNQKTQINDSELSKMLSYAKNYAHNGCVDEALNELRKAEEYASNAGIEMKPNVLERIKQSAYQFKIKLELNYAVNCAKNGFFEDARKHLDSTAICAADLGINISDKVRKIEAMLKENSLYNRVL